MSEYVCYICKGKIEPCLLVTGMGKPHMCPQGVPGSEWKIRKNRNKFIEIEKTDTEYHITPVSGWSIVIKTKYTVAKNDRVLKKCIGYWKKRGYKEVVYK